MVPPIGFPAVRKYLKDCREHLEGAMLIRQGCFRGDLVGAKLATELSNVGLERVFGIAMLGVVLKMLFAR